MNTDQRIHVFHVVNSLQIGGLEQVVVNLINSLNTESYRHSICCIDRVGPMAERLAVPVTIHNIGKGAKADRLVPFKIAKLLRKDLPHIVHTRNWSAIDGVLGARMAGVKAVIHDEHGRDAVDPEGRNLKRILVRRFLARWISCFVPVSDDLAKWLSDSVLVPKHKIKLILNGVDINKYSPPADMKAIRKSLSIPLEAFVVGFVGRLDPVKDIPTLLKAFCAVEQLLTIPVCLLIVGGGNQLTDLKRVVEELGISKSVIFKGEMQNIPEIMQCMDLFALTSIAEGMPMTLLEAMATGLPTVSTRVGGVPELIKDNVNGYLADVKDSEAVAKIICCYAQKPEMRKIHGNNARMTAVSEYSISTMVSKYNQLYKAVLSVN